VPHPAITNANGVVYIPPKIKSGNATAWEVFGVTAVIFFRLLYNANKKKKRRVANENLLDIEYNF
jgi:hypothetical protein